MFTLAKCDEKHFVFQHQPLFGDTEQLLVEFANGKSWSVTRAHMPVRCPDPTVDKKLQGQCEVVEMELRRAHVQKVLLECCKESALSSAQLAFSVHPNHVWTTKKVGKKGALKFFPCGTVSKLKGVPAQEKIYIRAYETQWLISPFKALTDFSKEEMDGVLAPYWWVKAATEEETPNMQKSEVTVDGCRIPVLMNAGAIGLHEKLLFENVKSSKKVKKGTD